MQSVAVVQDNREPGGNPGRSRRCVCGVFLLPDGSHCENGKTKKCKDAKSEDLPFCLEL